ncbi:predicted protein [Naegleria gruberi]|uniref:Predicted protein n=1 Tax=Naegleria gruberi TaxID=5762 RepID=D2V6U0_NAEGR|nr:uncharacterized protein NAEGRDRAFT_47127 [Naegleria gruberi]EFC47503.1 predicted protein [Naegleria gruberi]|eukprot:XP_002680247.1 predicted protein [Naegleria gruberi strain NEG-M]
MVTLRFCLYDFASSLDELNMKHRMLSLINHSQFSDISLQCQSLKSTDEEIRFEFPKLFTTRDWTTRRETIIWTNFGESLVLIAQIHRKSFPLYSIIISQILKQYEMFTNSKDLCVHFNPWLHSDKIVDIDIPRYLPLSNPFLSYSKFNKERFQKLFGCVFGDDVSFMPESVQQLLSSKRNIFNASPISIGNLHQRTTVLSKLITLPHYDPIMEDLIEFLYEMCYDLSPLSFVVGTSANHDLALMERDVFQLLVDLESPVLGFGDTNNPKFRNRLSTILRLLENEDDFNYYFTSKRRKHVETPIDNSDIYYLSQISQYIEMPSRLHTPTLRTNQEEKYLEASYKLKTEVENNDRFVNAPLLNYRRKVAENVKKLRTTTFSEYPKVIKLALKTSIASSYRRDHLVGLGTHYGTTILEVTNRRKLEYRIYQLRKFLGF